MASRETDTGTDINPDNHSIFKNCYICIFYILQLQSSTLRRTSENVSQNRYDPSGNRSFRGRNSHFPGRDTAVDSNHIIKGLLKLSLQNKYTA